MADFTRIDLEHLRAAKHKLRRATDQAERNVAGQDMVHALYKCQQFLAEALPDAWDATELKAPDYA